MRTLSLTLMLLLLSTSRVVAQTGHALIQPTTDDSPVSGEALLTDTPEGLEISIDLSGVSPGAHGVHIHQFGRCEEEGRAAGGHYNPDGVAHGLAHKDGFDHAHPGDLGNITIDDAGLGRLDVTVPGLSLIEGDYPVAGRAIIVHEQPDDFGQPTGNAGGRIGCGPIVIAGE